MAIGRQEHLPITTWVWSSLAVVPLIWIAALVGLAAHRPLRGAATAGVAAAGQELWLLWAFAIRCEGQPE